MKLALVLLLLIPAFQCTVVPDICERTEKYMRTGLFGSYGEFEAFLDQYTKNKALITSAMKMKVCASKMSTQEKIDYYAMSMKRMAYCESPKLEYGSV